MATGTIDKADTGWTTATLTTLFTEYDSGYPLKYRKRGHLVEVAGWIKPTSSIAGGTAQSNIFTLPDGFRPVVSLAILCQGSDDCVWCLRVGRSNGLVTFGRYRSVNTYLTATTSTWLPINFCFFTAD